MLRAWSSTTGLRRPTGRHLGTSVALQAAFRFPGTSKTGNSAPSSASRFVAPSPRGATQAWSGAKAMPNWPDSKPKWQQKEPSPEEPLGAGTHKLQFGKHTGKSFLEIYQEDPQYCKWATEMVMLRAGEKTSDSLNVFAAYVQHRWLSVISRAMQSAGVGCLSGKRLAVTGEPDEMPRPVLEGLIRILGGEVVSDRRIGPNGRSTKPSATAIVMAGPKLRDGRAVEESPKLRKAAEAGIPVMTLEDLLKLIAAPGSKPSS